MSNASANENEDAGILITHSREQNPELALERLQIHSVTAWQDLLRIAIVAGKSRQPDYTFEVTETEDPFEVVAQTLRFVTVSGRPLLTNSTVRDLEELRSEIDAIIKAHPPTFIEPEDDAQDNED